MSGNSSDQWIGRAFQLAYFLHGERKTAIEIATRAIKKLELAAAAQSKRLYYRLTGRADARKARSKVSLSEQHLLQRLVFVESEEFERLKETALLSTPDGTQPAGELDLLIFFIKHLVRITTRRNSFYVTLGLSRLLYNYTTPETMELYNLVIQDPDRVHDDYYYRSRKGVLLKEMKERFGELLEVTKGTRGEQRWKPKAGGERHELLVRECLQWFTPWSTPCVVPDRFDRLSNVIPALNFSGRQPDAEHEVEVNRIHAAMHPDCFARLVAANHLDAPQLRLELPAFNLVFDDDDPNDSSRTPPALSANELTSINELLAQEASRRRAASAGFVRVLVDGQERSQIDLQRSPTTTFRVDANEEIIELYAVDEHGPLLLATHLLTFGGSNHLPTAITLERGQRITFVSHELADSSGGIQMTVSYQEAGAGAVALINQAWQRLAIFGAELTQSPAGWWKPVLTAATLAILVLSGWWIWSSARKTTPPEVVKNNPAPAPVVPGQPSPPATDPIKRESVTPPGNQPPNSSASPAPPAGKHSPRQNQPEESFVARTMITESNPDPSESGVESTRAWDSVIMGKPLREVRQVYLQTATDDNYNREVKTLLQTRLSGAVQYADGEKADASLKISVRPASQRRDEQRVIAVVRVVNANGYVVWPKKGSIWRYVGLPRFVADRVVADLERSIASARRQPGQE